MLRHTISCKYCCVQFWGVSVNIDKLRVLWTVCWTDYGLCTELIMDCVLDWLWTVYWTDCGLCIGLILNCVLDWLWTVYWSDCGLCIGMIMDCVLDWLWTADWTDYSRLEWAQFIMWPIIIQKDSNTNFVHKSVCTIWFQIVLPIFSNQQVGFFSITIIYWACRHTNDIPFFKSIVHIKQPVSTDLCCN